ncbi:MULTISPECIES: hypothetical protein [Rhodomicrobium]|uniref:hypothetical protein n=1 Tax=Rhodomicrobium TaxID=1068 RepID=UPI000B4B73FA|nr:MULTISPECIES: hypothetical protein [Rhodomicrobium]
MARFPIIVAALALLAAPPAHAAAAQFKGLSVISKELSARIAPEEGPIELDRYMPADGLDDLVGTWAAFGTEHKFQNGQPNAVNMVLLRLTFAGFAQSLAQSCKSPQLLLNDSFFDTLEALCTWPSDEAKNEQVLTAFWLGIMGYNAPESEFAVWRDFVLGTYGEKPALEAIEGMTLALMLNPYFLLEQ